MLLLRPRRRVGGDGKGKEEKKVATALTGWQLDNARIAAWIGEAYKTPNSTSAQGLLNIAADALQTLEKSFTDLKQSIPVEVKQTAERLQSVRISVFTRTPSPGGGGGGGKQAQAAGEAGQGDLEKQTTFDCAKESESASRLGDQDFNSLIGMAREKNQFVLSFMYPFVYPFLFPEGKGILLYGPPGTGKTVISKAAARQLQQFIGPNIPILFYALTGSQLKGAYVGQTEKNIEAAFDCAEEKAGNQGTSIIFLDEVEVLGGKRGASKDAGLNASVTSLLTAIDGVKQRTHIRVIAATNRPWDLDEAFLSRFPLKIFVDTPGDVARRQLIYSELAKFYTRGLPREVWELDKLVKQSTSKQETLQIKNAAAIELRNKAIKFVNEFFTRFNMPAPFEIVANDQTLVANVSKFTLDQLEQQKTVIDLIKHPGDYKKFGSNLVFIKDANSKERLVDQVVAWTGMSKAGETRLYSTFKTAQGREKLDKFLAQAGKQAQNDAKSDFGYSNRDLVNLIQQAIRNAGLRAFTEPLKIQNSKTGCWIQPVNCDKTENEPCTPCDLNQYQRFILRAQPLKLEDFERAFQYVTSSINGAQYVDYVYYMFYDEQAVKEKESLTVQPAPTVLPTAPANQFEKLAVSLTDFYTKPSSLFKYVNNLMNDILVRNRPAFSKELVSALSTKFSSSSEELKQFVQEGISALTSIKSLEALTSAFAKNASTPEGRAFYEQLGRPREEVREVKEGGNRPLKRAQVPRRSSRIHVRAQKR